MNGFRALAAAFAALTVLATPALGGTPATPNFNLEVVLRPAAGGPDNGFGLVKFRQPKDASKIVNLDVWVRDLAPNHSYSLQRATDANVNDACTGTNWLTLGQGLVPAGIATPCHMTSSRLRRGSSGTGGLQRTPSSAAAAHSPSGSATTRAS